MTHINTCMRWAKADEFGDGKTSGRQAEKHLGASDFLDALGTPRLRVICVEPVCLMDKHFSSGLS